MATPEADMCDRIIPLFRDAGYRVLPEFKGWDFLAVREEDGWQVGVQAKMRANCEVLEQAMPPEYPAKHGPDIYGVLVPQAGSAFLGVARRLGVAVLEERHIAQPDGSGLMIYLDMANRPASAQLAPARYVLPELTIAGRAGLPSPAPLSEWRLKAIKLCERLRRNLYVTREDFRELGLTNVDLWLHPRGTKPPWLVRSGNHVPAQYVTGPGATLPDEGFAIRTP